MHINYYTIKDAEIPLQIKWFNDSFIKIPVKKINRLKNLKHNK